MNTMCRLLLAAAIFLSVLPFPVHAEDITSYDATVTIKQNGAVAVVERIDYDFGTEDRHGIFRTIPELKTNEAGKKFILSFSDFVVTDGKGGMYPFTQNRESNNYVLKIGDPQKTIQGRHTYELAYVVHGVLTYFSDHDELYWNVTGSEWQAPMKAASARVLLPIEFSPDMVRVSCYTGSQGSQESDCRWSYSQKDKAVSLITTRALSSHEGLTIVIGFPKGYVSVVEPKEYVPFWETTRGKMLLGLLIILAFLWYIIAPLVLPILWWKFGRDPKPLIGQATAWFSVPTGKEGRALTPGEAGTLLDERADSADITATIIDLARRGYVRIVEKTKGDIHLEKVAANEKEDQLRSHETLLLQGIFKKKDQVALKTADLVKVVSDTKNALYDAVVSEGFFPKNPQTVRNAFTVGSVLALITGNFILFLSLLFFGYHMPRKTIVGAGAAAVAQALKNFISSQERQYKFQAEKQFLFEKMLPFAIAFGVEKVWIARFAQMHLAKPDWYQGYATASRFNVITFSDSLHTASSNITRAATPTSSSSGFSSGFSGGSSGGGGGGGGGGSW